MPINKIFLEQPFPEPKVPAVVDKVHLKKAIWEVIETHLRRLDALYKELMKKFEAKDAEAVEKTGKYILECGMDDLISDANSLIVLDTLGEKVS